MVLVGIVYPHTRPCLKNASRFAETLGSVAEAQKEGIAVICKQR